MDSFEWNKVFASVIAAALLIMVITTLSDSLFHVEEGKPAFTIEVAEAASSEAAEEEEAGPSLAELLAGADASKGAKQFAKCQSCHTVDKGGANSTGPNLYGIVGRAVAGVAGVRYSSDLQAVGGTWTYELLDHWLANPKSVAKGTSMGYAGIRKADQRADLIAYLASMSDAPVPFPAADEAPAEAVEEAAEEEAAAAEEPAEHE